MDYVFIVIMKGRLFDECVGAYNADVWSEEEVAEQICMDKGIGLDEFEENYVVYHEQVQ